MPSGPRVTASSARVSATMLKQTSARAAASRGVGASWSPASTSQRARSRVRL